MFYNPLGHPHLSSSPPLPSPFQLVQLLREAQKEQPEGQGSAQMHESAGLGRFAAAGGEWVTYESWREVSTRRV